MNAIALRPDPQASLVEGPPAWSGDPAEINWSLVTIDGDSPPLANEGDALTPAGVIQALLDAPASVTVETGIPALDHLCHGGFPIPRRVIVVGMPGAWKTGFAVFVADKLERDGLCVGMLAIDEEPEDIVIRLAQMSGFDRQKLQNQDHAELAAARDGLSEARITFYDFTWTIERAAADLAQRAEAAGARAVFIVDSLQTARCNVLEGKASTPRDTVEANVAAFREVTTKYRMLSIATSEANRAAYRDGAGAQASLAAGAESRSIEYAAQTQIVLRADDEERDTLFHADVAKNRARSKGQFSFRLNQDTHLITCVASGVLDAERKDQEKVAKVAENARAVADDSIAVARELVETPGLLKTQLYDALRARHGSFAEPRADKGLRALGPGVVLRSAPKNAKAHYLAGNQLPLYVREALPGAAEARPPE